VEVTRDVAAAQECKQDWCCDQGVCSVLTCIYLNGQADSCFGCVAGKLFKNRNDTTLTQSLVVCEKDCGGC